MNALGHSAHLLNVMQVMSSGCDVVTLQLMRLQALLPVRGDMCVIGGRKRVWCV